MSPKKDTLQVIPFGGCGNIGMNMTLYYYNGTWIMVDCGIGFIEEGEGPGIDIKVPDLQILKDYNIEVSALIITHSHEDHIGGICYLIDYLNCPVYCTVFASNFLKNRVKNLKLDQDLEIIEVLPTRPVFKVGSLSIEMIGLTHSIVESQGLYIKGGNLKIFHTGDWKFDSDPVVGDTTNINRLEEVGREGLNLLVCDSTNVFKDEYSGTEASVEEELFNIIKDKKNRVVVGIFSSNVARIKTLYKVAQMTNRKLFISGTSLNRIVGIASKSGYIPDVEFSDIKNAGDVPRDQVLVICTGCQGEPLASIAKLANKKHSFLKLSSGDCVVLSSKIIPVNANRISKIINNFILQNIEVVTEKNQKVHVSGHPSAPELKELYKILKPKDALPVHGNPILLREHCRLATQEFGVQNAHFVSDGTVLSVSEDESQVIDKIEVGELGVDGYILRPLDSNIIKERKKIQNSGTIFCAICIDKKGKIVFDPIISSAGLLDEHDDADYIEDIINLVSSVAKKKINSSSLKRDGAFQVSIADSISQRIAQFIKHKLGKSPLVKTSVILT